jgi:hypothetical protein
MLARYVGWGGIKNAFPDATALSPRASRRSARSSTLLTPDEYDTARRSIQYAHYTAETWCARCGMPSSRWASRAAGVRARHGRRQLRRHDAGRHRRQHPLPASSSTTPPRASQKLLYPKWGVRQDDFTKTPLPENAFDLVIGNPPFADVAIKSDPKYAKQGFLLHDYFFAKSLDAVRPGGLLAFVTSAGTMNKIDTVGARISRRPRRSCRRHPPAGDAFKKNAGTEVTTDIIFLRKRLPGDDRGRPLVDRNRRRHAARRTASRSRATSAATSPSTRRWCWAKGLLRQALPGPLRGASRWASTSRLRSGEGNREPAAQRHVAVGRRPNTPSRFRHHREEGRHLLHRARRRAASGTAASAEGRPARQGRRGRQDRRRDRAHPRPDPDPRRAARGLRPTSTMRQRTPSARAQSAQQSLRRLCPRKFGPINKAVIQTGAGRT